MDIRTTTRVSYEDEREVYHLRDVCREWHDGPGCALNALYVDYLDDLGKDVAPKRVIAALDKILAKTTSTVETSRESLHRARAFVAKFVAREECARLAIKFAAKAKEAGYTYGQAYALFIDTASDVYNSAS